MILKANESKSGRALVGLLSAGVIGAIAAANTEEGFSEPKAYEYKFAIGSNDLRVIFSRSIVEIGSCVEVISPDESEIEILKVVGANYCEESYNNSMQPTAESGD